MQQHFCVCLSKRSLTQSFIRSFDDRSSIVRASERSFVHSFVFPFSYPSINPFIHQFIRSFVPSFIVQTTSNNVVTELINQ